MFGNVERFLEQRQLGNGIIFSALKNDWIGMDILGKGSWEPHIQVFLKRNLTNNDVLLDAGSHFGWHSINSSKLCKKIYSFEPQKPLYEVQKLNITQNNINNVELFNLALGSTKEIKNLHGVDYASESIHMGDLSLQHDGSVGESVEVTTIDSLNLDKLDYIKIDVQGYEKFLLEGGENTINALKPTIIIEIEDCQLGKFGVHSKDIFNILKNKNYEILFLDYHYPSDFICVHKDKYNEFLAKNSTFIEPLTCSNGLNCSFDFGINKKIVNI
jgi:FkbM family methyltransferase